MRIRSGNWFTTKVKYQKTDQEDGTEKMVTEAYLVDALTFTEAESSIIDEISVYVSGEFSVAGISKANYREILISDGDDDDKWYKVKISLIFLDEKTGKEKRATITQLVQAKSLARALRYVEEYMGQGQEDYEVVGINDTSIMDVFEHKTAGQKKEEKNDVPEYEQENAQPKAE